jgi:hypothetical protein
MAVDMTDPTVSIPVEAWAFAADQGLMEEARKLAGDGLDDLDDTLVRAIAVSTAARAMCMIRALDEARSRD